MKKLSNEEAMNINGGAKYYYCKICGYKNKSYWKVYKNAFGCTLAKGFNFLFPPVTVK